MVTELVYNTGRIWTHADWLQSLTVIHTASQQISTKHAWNSRHEARLWACRVHKHIPSLYLRSSQCYSRSSLMNEYVMLLNRMHTMSDTIVREEGHPLWKMMEDKSGWRGRGGGHYFKQEKWGKLPMGDSSPFCSWRMLRLLLVLE